LYICSHSSPNNARSPVPADACSIFALSSSILFLQVSSVSIINLSVNNRADSSSLFLRRLQISLVRRLVNILSSLAAIFSNSRFIHVPADEIVSFIKADIDARNSTGIYAKSSGYK
jgi:hypothetical protein